MILFIKVFGNKIILTFRNKFMYWYKKVVFENYANFNGRARRSEYWYFILFNAFILFVIFMY